MVGVIGFEPTTPSPPAKCATKLRYVPTQARIIMILSDNAMLIESYVEKSSIIARYRDTICDNPLFIIELNGYIL